MQVAVFGMNDGMPAKPGEKPPDEAQSKEVRRLQQQRAPIAQLLLVARLRARNRRDAARDLLERAAQMISITCKNWFSSGGNVAVKAPAVAIDTKQKSIPATALTHTESPHAHRHD
jgi:hypothetical protein